MKSIFQDFYIRSSLISVVFYYFVLVCTFSLGILQRYLVYRLWCRLIINYLSIVQKKRSNQINDWILKKAATYSPTSAVPSAQTGLTSLFGKVRGEPRRYNHLSFMTQLFKTVWSPYQPQGNNITYQYKNRKIAVKSLNKHLKQRVSFPTHPKVSRKTAYISLWVISITRLQTLLPLHL